MANVCAFILLATLPVAMLSYTLHPNLANNPLDLKVHTQYTKLPAGLPSATTKHGSTQKKMVARITTTQSHPNNQKVNTTRETQWVIIINSSSHHQSYNIPVEAPTNLPSVINGMLPFPGLT